MMPASITALIQRCAGCALGLVLMAGAAQGQVLQRPAAAPLGQEIPRIGLNLGGSSTWGAEQLMNNVLKNPGFEATRDRALVVVKSVQRDTVVDDVAWIARPDGFWNGGRFDVRTGPAAGQSGRILRSQRQGADGPGMFTLDPMPAGLQPGNALAVMVEAPPVGVPMWWLGSGQAVTTTNETRPGSSGRQSARLSAAAGQRTQLNHHLDAIGGRAGKLLPFNGDWKLGFWARGLGLRDQLTVQLMRPGSPVFLRTTVALRRDWAFYEFDIRPQDSGPPATVTLSFEIDAGMVLLDDVSLGAAVAGAGGFRSEVVAVLRELRPGYLRDWQGQLGDTLENRLADPFARHPVRYRPGEAEQLHLYSLPQFLELCAAVEAQPWIIAPPLLDDAEWRALGAYLARVGKRHQFREVLLEFGNENWNPLFRPAGFLGAALQAEAADRAFRLVREGAGGMQNLRLMVNAQYVNPQSWGQLAMLSRQADRVAVAPYLLHQLNQMPRSDAVAASFAETDAILRQGIGLARVQGKQIAVYEVNLHTTEGNADLALRNLVVSGAPSGPALARRLLQALLLGVREQAVYSLAGFDSYTGAGELVRLWGVTRDLAPGQLRPTGLAMALMNRAIGGEMRASECVGEKERCEALTAAWFSKRGTQSLLVVSAAAVSTTIDTPFSCSRPYQLTLLDGHDENANNELPAQSIAPRVVSAPAQARCKGQWQFDLPAHSMALISQVTMPGKYQDGRR